MSEDHHSPKLEERPGALEEELPGQNSNSRQLDDHGGCRTPVSEDHKILAALSCPPTPRKQRVLAASSRKRKLLHFFEASGREEVESFFRTSFLELSNKADKRRCTSI